jgi:signal transduction histidine kinase
MLENLARTLACDISEANLPVRAEQLRARLSSYPLLIAGQAMIALLLAWLMWSKVAHNVLLAWIWILFSVHAMEAFLVWRYRDATRTLAECRLWRARIIGLVILAGAVWGGGGMLLFVQNDLAYQAMLICVVLGVAAGAVTTNPVFPPALYIYVTLLILPILAVNVAVGDRTHFIIAAMLAVYLAFVLNAGKDLSRIFELSLRRRFENERLVGQLTEEKQRAEQANRMKSKFLAAASHDLRQPMHALTLFVEMLKSHVNDPQAAQLVGQVEHSVEVLSSMFDALLDISKLDAGVVQPYHENFAIQPLLDRMYDEFSWLARDKGLSFEMARSEHVVCSDPLLLERILRNLISNAIRYTEHGEVALACKQVAEGLQLEVRDSGIGIASEHLPHIFEEYYQVGNQQRNRNEGLGLGLAIVKRLEQLLGYRMKLDSTLGVGSCFTFVVPSADASVAASHDDMINPVKNL